MAGRAPRSVRFDPSVADRLEAYVAAHPERSGAAMINQFVDEALRMREHPGVFFRDGPRGRRAVLIGGPDVWEVIRDVRSAREADPDLSGDDLVARVSSNTGVSPRLIRTAIRYWSQYPDEVDAFVAAAERVERVTYEAWRREQGLLAG